MTETLIIAAGAILLVLIGMGIGLLAATRRAKPTYTETETDLLLTLERVLRGDEAAAFEMLASRTETPDAAPALYLALAALLRAWATPTDRSRSTAPSHRGRTSSAPSWSAPGSGWRPTTCTWVR